MPTCKTIPLVDDDLLKVESGEFVVRRVEKAVRDRLEDIATIISGFKVGATGIDRPTMVAAPSRKCAREIQAKLAEFNTPSIVIDGESSRKERNAAYKSCEECASILIHIAVVGEGVNLKFLRRLLDCRPSLSPVAWYQQFGRITRCVEEGEEPPEYISCTRNLERHGYLLGDLLPAGARIEAETIFGSRSKRSAVRTLGLEGASRFKRHELALVNGTHGEAVYIEQYSPVTGSNQYCIIMAPHRAEPIVAARQNVPGKWGKWNRATLPLDLVGFGTVAMRSPATDNQRDAWEKYGAKWGLDPELPKDAKIRDVTPLFVMMNLGERL
jgi:hypothetical protein